MKGGSLAKPTITDLIEKENRASTPSPEADGKTEKQPLIGDGPLPQPG